MRPSVMSVMLLIFLLLTLATKAQGIRLEVESSAAFQKRIHEKGSLMGGVGVICKDHDGHCSGTKKEKRSFRAVKEVRHRLPGFHEDYYGPRDHKPKHH